MIATRTRRSTAALVGVLLAATLLVWPTTAAAADPVGFKHATAFTKVVAGSHVTGEKPESKLWFHDGSWWATMLGDDGTGLRHSIHELDAGVWEDTGVVVDASPEARGDALVLGGRLYLTSRGPNRLFRADYDTTDRTWVADGEPVDLPVDGDAAALTIARDTQGKLWLAWFGDGAARYAVSDDDGDTWGPATTLPFPEATVDGAATAAIIAFTDDVGPAVGIMWSRQENGSSAQSFAVHRDGDPTEQWDREIAIEGSSQVDDHINLKTRDGSVYAAVKTEANEEGQTLIKVLVRSPAGDWQAHPVAAFGDSDTRPIAVLELSGSNAYVFTSRQFVHSVDPDTGEEKTSREIVLRQALISELDADPDGNPFSEPEVFIRSDTSKGVDDATSMKANPTADSDIVVMASTSSHYWWNRRDVDAPPPPPSPEYELTTSVEGEGAVDPAEGTYDEGEEVDLTATAATGWQFTGWSPNVTPTGDDTGTVLMTADTHVTASFARETHALTTTTDGDGTIQLDPPGGTYESGTDVTLTATAAAGWHFTGWSGDLDGATNPQTLTMTADKAVTATFAEDAPEPEPQDPILRSVARLGPPRACAPAYVPRSGLDDIRRTSHRQMIECIAWYRITMGVGDIDRDGRQEYAPNRKVSREEMASFLTRMAAEAGIDLPSNPRDAFDDDGGTHHKAINQLAALGITNGVGDLDGDGRVEYAPKRSVSREEMATFIKRLLAETGVRLPSGSRNVFDDVRRGTHRAAINQLAVLGISNGLGDIDGDGKPEYGPKRSVTRAEMGSFLGRSLDVLAVARKVVAGGARTQLSSDGPGTLEGSVTSHHAIRSVIASGCGLSGHRVGAGRTFSLSLGSPPDGCRVTLTVATQKPWTSTLQRVKWTHTIEHD